jgi:lysophospholipase L1-like esterase
MRHLTSTSLSVLWLTCSFGSSLALAEKPADPAKTARYLAIGDSLAFGYRPDVPVALANYVGYPQIVSDAMNLKVANASCFGETSSHALDLTKPDLGCAWWRSQFPLFVNYSGTQIDYAVEFLRDRKSAKLVTIDIGLNDLGVLLQACANDPDPTACGFNGLPAVLGQYAQNLATIYTRIRQTGYSGPIVAVTAYAFNYADPIQVGAISALNGFLATVSAGFGAQIADAYTAFGAAAVPYGGDVCLTGLLFTWPDHTCDTHPSAAGQALLANLVMSVAGKK